MAASCASPGWGDHGWATTQVYPALTLSVDRSSSAPYGRGGAALEASGAGWKCAGLPAERAEWRFDGQPIRMSRISIKAFDVS